MQVSNFAAISSGKASAIPISGDNSSYHRRLIEVSVIVVVLGAVFLMFWQSVLRSQPTIQFTTDYCTNQLENYIPGSGSAATLDAASDGKLANCKIEGTSVKDVGLAWASSYECSSSIVRYFTAENPNWLAIGIQNEVPQLVYFNGTLVANTTGLQRFSYSVIIFNPVSHSSFDSTVEKLKAKDCEIVI